MTHSKTPIIQKSVNLHSIPELVEIRVRDGVILRPLAIEDAARILEILDADPSIRRRVSVASALHSSKDVATQVETYRENPDLLRYALLVDSEVVGLISFWRDVASPFDPLGNLDDYGFGYFLDPAQRGKGLITDAVQKVMEVSRKALPAQQFIANCEDDNPGSIAILTKLGFEPTDLTYMSRDLNCLERKYVQVER